MRRFPLSLFIYPKLCSFGLLLKMRCIFFTEQPYTDQGSAPGPPYAVSFFCNRRAGALARSLGLGWAFPVPKPTFGLRLLVSQGFLYAKAGHPDQRFGIEKLMLCANALCQNSRIRLSPNSGTVCRFSLWNVFPLMEPAF